MRLIHLEPRPVHFPSPTHHHRSSSNNIQQHPTTSNNIQQHPTTGPCSPSRRRCDGDRPRPFRVPFLFCVPFFFLNFADFSGLSPVGSSFLLIFRNGRQSSFFFRCKPSQPVADRYDADDADADGRWPPQRPAADEIDERNNKQTNTNKIRFFFCFRFASVPQQPRPSNRRRQEKKEQGKPNNGVEGSKGRPNDRR